MSSSDIPVLSDPQFDLEAEKYFLRCMSNYPNLYDEKNKYYKDKLMKKDSWGLLAKDNGMTLTEAMDMWQHLVEQYTEEENLQSAASCCNDTSNDSTENSFFHYSAMNKLLTPTTSQLLTQSTPRAMSKDKQNANKSGLVVNKVEKAKLLNQQVRQRLVNQLKVTSTPNPNALAGRIVFKELQGKSPQDAEGRRSRLLKLVAKLNHTISNNVRDDATV